jgi:hypothetical protein
MKAGKNPLFSYIKKFFGDEEIAEKIYYTLLEEPAIYLPYAVGCLEIMELKDRAENALGNQFNAKEFHRFLLDIGPAEFDVINNYMTDWLSKH